MAEIAEIVKHHHTKWHEWKEPIENEQVISSQIVLLADYIERLINRDKYILHQVDHLIEQVKLLSEKEVRTSRGRIRESEKQSDDR